MSTMKWLTGTLEKSHADPRRITFIASHEKVDRAGEVIMVAGIDLTAFQRNPVLLRQHNRQEVVGRVERLRKTTIDGADALVGEATFPDRPQSNDTLADIRAGLLNAVSIGFLAHERRAPVQRDQSGPTYTKTSLLEISVVSLPACPTCMITSKGLTTCASCAGDDDVLAGIVFPPLRRDQPDVLDIEDEHEHVLQSASTINRIIRETFREAIRETISRDVRRELNHHRGRLDDM